MAHMIVLWIHGGRLCNLLMTFSDFIQPFYGLMWESFPIQKQPFFPIACILALIFPILTKYFPKCEGKGSFPGILLEISVDGPKGSRGNGPVGVPGGLHPRAENDSSIAGSLYLSSP